MKPFTFMIVVLGLVLGFALAASRDTVVSAPAPPLFVRTAVVDVDPDDDADEVRDREEVADLPVPIVPGTRVTEAEILPPKKPGVKPRPPVRPRTPRRYVPRAGDVSFPSAIRPISGRLSATAERARDDARLQLEREVSEWLTPEVPTHWRAPSSLLSRMIRKTEVRPIVRDYGTVYEATLEADFSPTNRDRLLGAHRREVVAQRLAVLGGVFAFVLVCLAAVAGYIRADEATKGYYTHWLRAAAAAGVGASGVVIYQWLA